MPSRPRVLSGMQPTGDSLHLGNYLGALRYWVTLQDTHDAFYCVVDLHSLTLNPEPATLRRRTRVHAAQFLAAGVDPDRSALFLQSHVPQHTELSWILSCITGYGEASRMTQFKDKSARAGADRTNVGLFTYPILQAADILVYQAASVPVGEDQRQHLELTRDLAQRFNTRYGETFIVPAAHIVKETAKISDLQHVDAKMSGSVGGPGCVWLTDDARTVEKRIRSAVTDTETEVRFDPERKPGVSNLMTILSAFSAEPVDSIEQRFAGRGYGDLKKETSAAVVEWLEPFQQRVARWLDDEKALDAVLASGSARARSVAEETMEQVRSAVGLLPVSS